LTTKNIIIIGRNLKKILYKFRGILFGNSGIPGIPEAEGLAMVGKTNRKDKFLA